MSLGLEGLSLCASKGSLLPGGLPAKFIFIDGISSLVSLPLALWKVYTLLLAVMRTPSHETTRKTRVPGFMAVTEPTKPRIPPFSHAAFTEGWPSQEDEDDAGAAPWV